MRKNRITRKCDNPNCDVMVTKIASAFKNHKYVHHSKECADSNPNVIRERSKNRPRGYANNSMKVCEFCGSDYKPTNRGTRWCQICVPTANGDRMAHHRASTYNITQPQFEALLAVQGNACGICGIDFATISTRARHIDHDHRTGKVRGVLCHDCNIKLGVLESVFGELLPRALNATNTASLPITTETSD